MKRNEKIALWTGILLVSIIAIYLYKINIFLFTFIFGLFSVLLFFYERILEYLKTSYLREDSVYKAVEYFNEFWSEKVEKGEIVDWKDIYVKEGWFVDGRSAEKLVGINAVRPGTNMRIVAIIGFNPIRVVGIKETIKAEDNDPFKYFTDLTPLPTKNTDVTRHPKVLDGRDGWGRKTRDEELEKFDEYEKI